VVYKERFVTVIKCQGKILRENGDLVTLPFGSEYSLLLKNLESKRASVKIEIDGKDVLDGCALIIDPNSEIELERFVEKLDEGNRFKFIQKTKEIQDFRGDKIDDGIIRVEVTYEKNSFVQISCGGFRYRSNGVEYFGHPYSHTGDSESLRGFNYTSSNSSPTFSCSYDNIPVAGNIPSNVENDISEDEGITVKGSISNQKFKTTNIGELEDESHVIILRLKGTTSKNIQVQKPITVKTKIQCETCGRKWKSHIKYCGNCGTSLI